MSGTSLNGKALFKSACITSTFVPLTRAKHIVKSKSVWKELPKSIHIGGLEQTGGHFPTSSTETFWPYLIVSKNKVIKTQGGQMILTKLFS